MGLCRASRDLNDSRGGGKHGGGIETRKNVALHDHHCEEVVFIHSGDNREQLECSEPG